MTTDDERAASRCLCFNLRRAARSVTRFFDAAIRPSGIGAVRFSLLLAIAEHQPVAFRDLARFAQLDRSTLSRDLGALEERGLTVSRDAWRDGRLRVVALSDAGRATVAAWAPQWESAQERLRSSLGEGAEARLLDALRATAERTRGGR